MKKLWIANVSHTIVPGVQTTFFFQSEEPTITEIKARFNEFPDVLKIESLTSVEPLAVASNQSRQALEDFSKEQVNLIDENQPMATNCTKYTIVVRGDTEEDREDALSEAIDRIQAGNNSGSDRREGSAFYFESTDSVPASEEPA